MIIKLISFFFIVLALSHLSSLVKKELAKVLLFEAHPYKNTISNHIKTAFHHIKRVKMKSFFLKFSIKAK